MKQGYELIGKDGMISIKKDKMNIYLIEKSRVVIESYMGSRLEPIVLTS